MQTQKQIAQEPSLWLGDFHPLVEQLGLVDGLVTLETVSASLQIKRVEDFKTLQEFLKNYQSQILLPLELPAIRDAFNHASHNELRELIAFDQKTAGEPLLKNFAEASQRVGESQLQRLRPLRDQRLVQRYIAAVESGEAHGWHTLVYGMTLAVYSLPLRQGMHRYAVETMRGFIHAAGRSLHFSELKAAKLLEELCNDAPVKIENLLSATVDYAELK
jgi:urease accessory protein